MSSSSYSRRTSSLSTVPTACPQAPTTQSRRPKVTTPTEERHSIRVVPSSTRSSLGDRRTIEDKRSSYIRKRASAQSPFFSAGYRASSSSYRSPPAFLTEKQKKSRNFLSPSTANTIVKPDDDVEEGKEKEIPCTSMEKAGSIFPGSLRKHRSTKSLVREAKKTSSSPRPATTVVTASTAMVRRASTRKSLLVSELKASLNDLTGSEIYDNAELSESVYTDEEDDIEDYEKRTTVKPGQYTLPPLNLDSRRRSALREKRSSKRNSQPKNKDRELKRTSEREPTPHYLAKEHGGKENISSSYTLGKITPIPESKVISRAALSPVRPSSSNVARTTQSVAVPRKSVLREKARPDSRAISTTGSTNERHSRRSLHSRNQSRVSGTRRSYRGHSRSQSSAFPFFDPNVTQDSASIGEAISTPTPAAKTASKGNPSSVTRDLSGNLIYHGDETLGSSSMVFNPSSVSRPRLSNVPSGVPGRQNTGLGLYPSGSSAAELNGERVRNPLSVIGASVDAEREETPVKGRRTWGEGLKSMMSRGSVWGWDKERDDVKVFV